MKQSGALVVCPQEHSSLLVRSDGPSGQGPPVCHYYIRKGWIISGLEQFFFFFCFFFPLEDKIHFLPVSHFFIQTWANRVGECPVCRDAALDAWKLPGVVRNPVSKSKMKKWLRKTPGRDLWPPYTQAQAPAHTCMPTIRNTYTQHTHIHTQRKGDGCRICCPLQPPPPGSLACSRDTES